MLSQLCNDDTYMTKSAVEWSKYCDCPNQYYSNMLIDFREEMRDYPDLIASFDESCTSASARDIQVRISGKIAKEDISTVHTRTQLSRYMILY
jgi:hypothetical protein